MASPATPSTSVVAVVPALPVQRGAAIPVEEDRAVTMATCVKLCGRAEQFNVSLVPHIDQFFEGASINLHDGAGVDPIRGQRFRKRPCHVFHRQSIEL